MLEVCHNHIESNEDRGTKNDNRKILMRIQEIKTKKKNLTKIIVNEYAQSSRSGRINIKSSHLLVQCAGFYSGTIAKVLSNLVKCVRRNRL